MRKKFYREQINLNGQINILTNVGIFLMISMGIIVGTQGYWRSMLICWGLAIMFIMVKGFNKTETESFRKELEDQENEK